MIKSTEKKKQHSDLSYIKDDKTAQNPNYHIQQPYQPTQEIEQYMGEGYSQVYEFVSVDSNVNKIIYCFEVNNPENLSASDYLKTSLEGDDFEEITSETICEKEFYKTKIARPGETGGDYVEDCYVCENNGKLLCIDYWHLSTTENNLAQMLQKAE